MGRIYSYDIHHKDNLIGYLDTGTQKFQSFRRSIGEGTNWYFIMSQLDNDSQDYEIFTGYYEVYKNNIDRTIFHNLDKSHSLEKAIKITSDNKVKIDTMSTITNFKLIGMLPVFGLKYDIYILYITTEQDKHKVFLGSPERLYLDRCNDYVTRIRSQDGKETFGSIDFDSTGDQRYSINKSLSKIQKDYNPIRYRRLDSDVCRSIRNFFNMNNYSSNPIKDIGSVSSVSGYQVYSKSKDLKAISFKS